MYGPLGPSFCLCKYNSNNLAFYSHKLLHESCYSSLVLQRIYSCDISVFSHKRECQRRQWPEYQKKKERRMRKEGKTTQAVEALRSSSPPRGIATPHPPSQLCDQWRNHRFVTMNNLIAQGNKICFL